MPLSETRYEHVVLDEKGSPRIKGTSYKVIHLVEERLAYGWSPEELHFQHPDLTLGQIYSALAYYSDHTDALDADIRKELDGYDEQRKAAGVSPVIEKLRAGGQPR